MCACVFVTLGWGCIVLGLSKHCPVSMGAVFGVRFALVYFRDKQEEGRNLMLWGVRYELG